jgi:hypothetical protein
MTEKHIQHIDLQEVLELLPAFSQGHSNGTELRSVPPQFAYDVMWHFFQLAEHFLPKTILWPACPTEVAWCADDAYLNGLPPVDDLRCIINDFLGGAWALLSSALNDECELSREYNRARMEELKVFDAIKEEISCIIDPADEDYWIVTALAIFQYDTLFGMLKKARFDDAYYIIDDLAMIRCNLTARDVKSYSVNWKKMAAVKAAQAKHSPRNQVKSIILAEWCATGAEYNSRADFSRILGDLHGEKHRTVYDWVTQHINSSE